VAILQELPGRNKTWRYFPDDALRLVSCQSPGNSLFVVVMGHQGSGKQNTLIGGKKIGGVMPALLRHPAKTLKKGYFNG
jgi:hypothetical protein